jgi:CheY-like chemotaxis protein
MIVEDDPVVLRVLTRLLGSIEGRFKVLTAKNGAEALLFLQSYPVALVLTDYNMPEMNGIDLAMQVKQASPATRVALLTAYATPDMECRAHSAGVDYFLAKPFHIDELDRIVQRALQ